MSESTFYKEIFGTVKPPILMGAEMMRNNRQTWPSIARAGRAIATVSGLAVGVLVGGGPLGTQTASAESIRIGGSGAALPTMRLLGEALKQTAPEFSLVMVPDLGTAGGLRALRSEEHTSELQSPDHLVCRLLLEK